MDTNKSFKILKLQAENIKRLKAIEIVPNGNLVKITGRNGQGKTSILDCIWWALAGAGTIQDKPIRDGQKKAEIKLNLGTIIVTRRFRSGKDGQVLTDLIAETAEGAKYPSPQKMIDDLLGELTFDPLGFQRMDQKAQFETIRQFVPGVDFEKIDEDNKTDAAKRTDLNRKIKELTTFADAIILTEDVPDEPIDQSELLDKMEKATKHNAEIRERENNRAIARNKIKDDTIRKAEMIKELEDLVAKVEELKKAIETKTKETADLQAKLDAAPPLPDAIDIAGIRQQIDNSKRINDMVEKKKKKESYSNEILSLEKESQKIAFAIEQRKKDKMEKISAAKFPIPGLSIGDGCIIYNDIPFNQASDAEQLRISIAIAMALNPRLKIIRVRDGSLLDDNSMLMLEKIAAEKDYQIWIERVDSSGKVGFVIEDGEVKTSENEELKTTPAKKEPAQQSRADKF